MGRRRRSQKKVTTKKKAVLAKVFKCSFCSHEDAVKVTMKHRDGIGYLSCGVCGVTFQAKINYLSEPIDVYCEWIDECAAVNEDNGGEGEGNEALAEGGSSEYN